MPEPGPNDVLIQVCACGVCRTDLHIVDGELPKPKLPLILGHEIVGRVVAMGERVDRFREGDRVGVSWLGQTCGRCARCRSGRENLCEKAAFTGYRIDGGYADYVTADSRYCFTIPHQYQDIQAAPLLCAGPIGYRGLRLAGDARRIGIWGSGAAAHIVAQIARYEGRKIYSFIRPDDRAAQTFARRLTGGWVGGSDQTPPEELDAALIFAGDGALVPRALSVLAPGGTVVCAGIHMSEIPAFPFEMLRRERTIRSVANLTRRDAEDFLVMAPRVPVRTETVAFSLTMANEALTGVRDGTLTGAAVLVPGT